ncbi:MAG: quercetin dioxygenase-like cupin family protein [Halieaceae bacterium]
MLSKTRSCRPVIFGLFLLAFVMPAIGAGLAEEVDPVDVSPKQFKIDFENDHVRIVSYHLRPGESDNWHTHPAKVSVITGGGLLRITTADGESFEVIEEAGAASWMPALGRHFAENVGDTMVNIVLVEIK